jgi:hypothetical protein
VKNAGILRRVKEEKNILRTAIPRSFDGLGTRALTKVEA